MKYAIILAAAPAAFAAIHDVKVGQSGLVFEPQTLDAAVGDQVRFTFWPQHDVAQGPFDKACEPSGFYSGRLTFEGSGAASNTFLVNVTDDKPMWMYCTSGQHCQQGMVGGINVPKQGERTIETYAAAAAAAPANVRPQGAQVQGGVLESAQSMPTPAPSPTAAPEGAAASVKVMSSTVLAVVVGVAAWFL